jgi:phytoene synthase
MQEQVVTAQQEPALSAAERERGWSECWEILREHGKTFHLMARVLGPRRGSAIAAVYGFARVADDLVDEPPAGAGVEEIRERLRRMQAELRVALDGRSLEPRFAVLGETLREYQIPLQPFDDLVAGLEMDLDRAEYRTFADLDLYCYRVAGTIGLMITPVAGYCAGSQALEHAKTLGTAMQLTNILRDVGEDLRRGRVYLPDEDLAAFGLTREDLVARRVDDRFRRMMAFQIDRAERLYDDGLKLIPLVSTARGRTAFEFAAVAYSGILRKIRASGYDVFGQRAHLSFGEKLALVPGSAWRAWTGRGTSVRSGRSP